jgi:hypothetical protein
MEDIMDDRSLRRKLEMISYGSTDFGNFKGSDITRSKFPFYAEPLNTSGRRYSKINEVSDLELYRSSSDVSVALLSRLGCL